MIFPALYNGPINYYARLIRQPELVLEQYDTYSKQTYRNRCRIMGPNGVVTLSIPVNRKRGARSLMRDVRIDYGSGWNKIHWRSLVASYASSPYFEYLKEEIRPFYERRYEYLIDLNRALIERTLGFMDLALSVRCTESFQPITSETDPRSFIHPKKDQAVVDPDFMPSTYHQVFSDRLGFRPNLSILDLIFNLGPETRLHLQRCLKT